MKLRHLALLAALAAAPVLAAGDPDYVKSVEDWRAHAEQGLRKDNGWLTLAGRYVMKPGVNTFGTGHANDIVFPKGLGPERMGTVTVEPGRVFVKLEPGLSMVKDGIPMTDKVMGTDLENRDWVAMGRAAFHVIERDGKYILRLADNESEVRGHFGGRVWYGVDKGYLVRAKYVEYRPARKIPIVNILDEVSDETAPGYVEFKLKGKTYKLDALDEDDGLFIILRDGTAGHTTYGSGRFLFVQKKPASGATFMLDLNRVYNPPCAFSEFTTCPLPPKQNILKVKIEAGEKYPPRKLG
jgi:uncharacterized protein (DUF1684 family)